MDIDKEEKEYYSSCCIFIGGCFLLLVGIVLIIWGINFIISLFKG